MIKNDNQLNISQNIVNKWYLITIGLLIWLLNKVTDFFVLRFVLPTN